MCSLLLPWDLNQSGAKCHCISEPALSQRGPSWCFPAPEGDRTGLELGWVLGLSLIFFFSLFCGCCGFGSVLHRLCTFLLLQKQAEQHGSGSGWVGVSPAPHRSPPSAVTRSCVVAAVLTAAHRSMARAGAQIWGVLGANGGKERMCR